MSDRIDLTQFEEITKGTWEVIDTPNGRIDIGVRQGGGHNPVVTFTESMAKQVRNIPRDVADMNAIAAVPELIAELKRCYEELNEANKVESAVQSVLDNWDICMDDYSMHDLYNNLDEKYARNDEGRIILKELHSYTEEDGWQRKEPASE